MIRRKNNTGRNAKKKKSLKMQAPVGWDIKGIIHSELCWQGPWKGGLSHGNKPAGAESIEFLVKNKDLKRSGTFDLQGCCSQDPSRCKKMNLKKTLFISDIHPPESSQDPHTHRGGEKKEKEKENSEKRVGVPDKKNHPHV